jgi:hypothetical protein
MIVLTFKLFFFCIFFYLTDRKNAKRLKESSHTERKKERNKERKKERIFENHFNFTNKKMQLWLYNAFKIIVNFKAADITRTINE